MNDETMGSPDANMDNIIILNDEYGDDMAFEFLELIEYGSEEYVILLPIDEDDEDEDAGEVVILRIDDAGDETESYSSVDDEETLNAVFEIFKDKFKDNFNFID